MKYTLLATLALFIVSAPYAHAADLHRFWSETYKGHFYTPVEQERQATSTNDDWEYEGVAYQIADESTGVPAYRFWSENYKHHFFTISEDEKDTIIEEDKNWNFEGIGFYVATEGSPVYRFWSPTFNGHFYTNSEVEKTNLEDNDPNWNYEGIAWYAGTGENALSTPESLTPESLTITIRNDEEGAITEEEIAERIIIENNIVIENIIGELPCFAQSDIDGDGWGWNGKEGCSVHEHKRKTKEKVYVCPADPTFRIYDDYTSNGKYDEGEPFRWGFPQVSGFNMITRDEDQELVRYDYTQGFTEGSYRTHHRDGAGGSMQVAQFVVDDYCNLSYPNGQDIAYMVGRTQYPIPLSCSVTPTFREYEDLNANKQYDDGEPSQITQGYKTGDAHWTYKKGESPNENITSIIFDKGEYQAYGHIAGGGSAKAIEFEIDDYCNITYPLGNDVWYYKREDKLSAIVNRLNR